MTKKQKLELKEQNVMYRPSDVEPIFGIARIEDKLHIVMGQNVVSQNKFNTIKEAEDYIASKPYELILNAAVLLFQFTQNNKENGQQLKK